MIHEQSQWIERLAYLFAGVAAVSLSQAALLVTLVAGLLSAILAGIRIHDRIKYGRIGE